MMAHPTSAKIGLPLSFFPYIKLTFEFHPYRTCLQDYLPPRKLVRWSYHPYHAISRNLNDSLLLLPSENNLRISGFPYKFVGDVADNLNSSLQKSIFNGGSMLIKIIQKSTEGHLVPQVILVDLLHHFIGTGVTVRIIYDEP